METFVIIDEDSIEITLYHSILEVEVQGKTLIVGDIVVDKLAAKTPLSESSTYLIVQKVAEEAIVEFDLVYVTPTGGVMVATNNLGSNEAFVLGLAIADTLLGDKVDVLILGVVSDPIFSALALNTPIYLDVGGAITDDIPKKVNGANFATPVGRALGSGSILINVLSPLTLA
jgi:hypothetical protein